MSDSLDPICNTKPGRIPITFPGSSIPSRIGDQRSPQIRWASRYADTNTRGARGCRCESVYVIQVVQIFSACRWASHARRTISCLGTMISAIIRRIPHPYRRVKIGAGICIPIWKTSWILKDSRMKNSSTIATDSGCLLQSKFTKGLKDHHTLPLCV